MRSILHDATAPAPPEVPPIPSSTIRFASTYPALHDAALLARRVILSARRAVFIDRRPASLGTRSVSANLLARCVMRRIHSNAKFNCELRRKNQEPSNKAPDKILRRKIKIGPDKLAQKPDLEAKFYAQLLKKAAI